MDIPVITNPASGNSKLDQQDTWRHSANHSYWQADQRLPVMGRKQKQEKILFIVPPYVSHENFVNPTIYEATMLKNGRSYKNVVADMPLAFLSMSAYLKEQANVDIKCTDFNVTLNKLEYFEYESFVAKFRAVLSSEEFIECPSFVNLTCALLFLCLISLFSFFKFYDNILKFQKLDNIITIFFIIFGSHEIYMGEKCCGGF